MRIAGRIDDVRSAVDEARRAGATVVFVPTMGALHEGHLSLARAGRAAAGGKAFVVLSVFVNPTQFGPSEDFAAYPRDLARDVRLAESAGVDLVFAPTVEEMYPDPPRTRVEVTGLSEPLCGRSRKGHFAGVALVVSKLLNIVRPDLSVFGQKDGQQVAVVRRLAADLNLPGGILVAPTVREPDGVAMSSRNAYLSAAERKAASAIPRGLFAAERAFASGERDVERLLGLVRCEIGSEPLLALEYAELVEASDLTTWGGKGPAMLAVAARAGKARLIDNVVLSDGGPAGREHREGG